MEHIRISGRDRPRHITTQTRVRLGAVLRLLLLGAAVFTIAALTGAMLAGAAPAGSYHRTPGTAGTAALSGPGAAGLVAEEQSPEQLRGGPLAPVSEPEFALSMVYSGAAALTLAVAGLVIVGRRRRHW